MQEDRFTGPLDNQSRVDAEEALNKCVESLKGMLNKVNRDSEKSDTPPVQILMPPFVNVSSIFSYSFTFLSVLISP